MIDAVRCKGAGCNKLIGEYAGDRRFLIERANVIVTLGEVLHACPSCGTGTTIRPRVKPLDTKAPPVAR